METRTPPTRTASIPILLLDLPSRIHQPHDGTIKSYGMNKMTKMKYLIILSIAVICIVTCIYQSIPSFDEELEYYYDTLYKRQDLRIINIRKNPSEYEGVHLNSWTTFKTAYKTDSPTLDGEFFLKKLSRNELRNTMDSKNIELVMFDRQEKVIWLLWAVWGPSNSLNEGEWYTTVYYWKKIL